MKVALKDMNGDAIVAAVRFHCPSCKEAILHFSRSFPTTPFSYCENIESGTCELFTKEGEIIGKMRIDLANRRLKKITAKQIKWEWL